MNNQNCNKSLTEAMGVGSTIKGIWSPRHVSHSPYHGHHTHGNHHHSHGMSSNDRHGHHNHYHPRIEVDWLDVPRGQRNNAFIINLGYMGRAWNHFLDQEVKSGDIVFFGPEGTVIRYLPMDFGAFVKDVVGEVGRINEITGDYIVDETIELTKLSQYLQDKINTQLSGIGISDSNTISLTGVGTSTEPIKAELVISSKAENALVDDFGAFVKNSSITFNEYTYDVTFTDNLGNETIINLSGVQDDDIHLSGASLDQYNNLVLERSGANSIVVPLAELELMFTRDSNTIVFSGDGTKLERLEASVKLQSSDNAIEETVQGLRVSKDLQLFNNNNTNFQKQSDIQDGVLTLQGAGGLEGSGEFSQNQVQNQTIQLQLSQDTQSRISKGETQESWGDHSLAGYVKTDTTYSAIEGIRLDDTIFKADIDQSPENIIGIQDGLFQGNQKLYFHPAEQALFFTDNKGTEVEIDLSVLGQDEYVSAVSLDGSELILTLKNGSTLRTELKTLKVIETEDTDSVNLVGSGADSSKLKANVKIDPQSNNILTKSSSGLRVTKDLHLFDNSISKFITAQDVTAANDQELTIVGSDGLLGHGTFSQDASQDKTIEIKLATNTKDDIQKGVESHSWGDHAQAGYVKFTELEAQVIQILENIGSIGGN